MKTRIPSSVPFILGLLVLISLLPIRPAGAASTPEKEYKALVAEHDKAQAEFGKIYGAAKTDAEREKAMKNYPQPDKYAGRFLQLAEKNPKDAAALDALIWIVSRARYAPEADQALRRLTEDYVTSEKLGPACQSVVYSQSKEAEKLLRAALDKNPHEEVQAFATISLGRYLLNRGEDAKAKAEAEKLFERVAEKFARVKGYDRRLGEEAKAELFEIRNLAIGQVAPEIEGVDVDGKKFKLSDYAGKVRVIDFWGDW